MWSADSNPLRPARAAGGFTLVEAMVVLALITVMSMALNYAVRATLSADQQFETSARAAQQSQRLVHRIAARVGSSRRILGGDAVGEGYLAACDLSRFPMAPDARLPMIDETGDLGPDEAGSRSTGNVIVLVSETAGSPCVADADAGEVRMIDTYRLIVIYPHVVDRSIIQGGPPIRDVVIWYSRPFPSLQQVMEIPSKDHRESVISDLEDRYGFTHGWDPRLPVEQAFYEFDKDKFEDFPDANILLEEDVLMTQLPRLRFAESQLAETDPTVHDRRMVLTAVEEDGWTPHGLEIKIAGSAHARKAWIHVAVESAVQGGRKTAIHTTTTIVDAREY